MNNLDLHRKFMKRTVRAYIFSVLIGGITTAISLLFVVQYGDSYLQYVGLMTVTLLFVQIPFILSPIRNALEKYATSRIITKDVTTSTVTDQYLDDLSRTNFIYTIPAISTVITAIILMPPDEMGFYFFGAPFLAAVAGSFYFAITMIVQILYLKKRNNS